MKHKYALSMIVPAYNAEKYLEKCIDSLIGQATEYSYEIIIINDGSTDNTGTILKKYKNHNKIKIIDNIKNYGLGKSRNIGLENAKGEYVCFVDSDDYVCVNFIEKMLSVAYSQDADFVKCGHKVVGDILLKGRSYKNHVIDSVDSDKYSLKIDGYAWGFVAKTSLFKSNRFPEGFWYEDIVIRCRLIPSCKKIITIGDKLYYYRNNKAGLSQMAQKANSKKCFDQLVLMEQIISERERHKNSEYASAINADELTSVLWTRMRHLDQKKKQSGYRLLGLIIGKAGNDGKWIMSFEKKALKFAKEGKYCFWSLYSMLATIQKRLRHE